MRTYHIDMSSLLHQDLVETARRLGILPGLLLKVTVEHDKMELISEDGNRRKVIVGKRVKERTEVEPQGTISRYHYSYLPDLILDVAAEGLNKELNANLREQFDGNFKQQEGITITGNKAVIAIETPRGLKKFCINVTPIE